MRIFAHPADLDAAVGEHLGYSDWTVISQQMIDEFAETTRDRQWIHVDRERSAAGPFGTTIAHGYLTLSMIGGWSSEIFELQGCSAIINYGLKSTRFLAPVPSGSRLRAGAEIAAVEPISGGRRVTLAFTVDLEGSEKPALVAETILLAYEEQAS